MVPSTCVYDLFYDRHGIRLVVQALSVYKTPGSFPQQSVGYFSSHPFILPTRLFSLLPSSYCTCPQVLTVPHFAKEVVVHVSARSFIGGMMENRSGTNATMVSASTLRVEPLPPSLHPLLSRPSCLHLHLCWIRHLCCVHPLRFPVQHSLPFWTFFPTSQNQI